MIHVEGNAIRAVASELAIPAGTAVIDLSTSTVMPGLIDCHVHITGEAGGNYYDHLFRKSFVDAAVLEQPVAPGHRTLGRIAWHLAQTIPAMMDRTGLAIDSRPQVPTGSRDRPP